MSTRGKRKSPARQPHRRVLAVLVALLFIAASSCSGSERPSEAEWTPQWEQRQELIPDAEMILIGGRELCDDLDGQFRVSLRKLLPSPTEELDGPVDEWIAHAVSIVFECSDDSSTIAQQLKMLEVLAAEINGGLSSEER